MSNRGLTAFGLHVLGPLELEDDGDNLGEIMTAQVHKIAQRALGDCFEQLAQIAESGRFKACGERYAAKAPDEVSRRELSAVLTFAEDVITCARAQLEYLPHSRYRLGDQVAFYADGEGVVGRVDGTTKDGRVRVVTGNGPKIPSRVYEANEDELHPAVLLSDPGEQLEAEREVSP